MNTFESKYAENMIYDITGLSKYLSSRIAKYTNLYPYPTYEYVCNFCSFFGMCINAYFNLINDNITRHTIILTIDICVVLSDDMLGGVNVYITKKNFYKFDLLEYEGNSYDEKKYMELTDKYGFEENYIDGLMIDASLRVSDRGLLVFHPKTKTIICVGDEYITKFIVDLEMMYEFIEKVINKKSF